AGGGGGGGGGEGGEPRPGGKGASGRAASRPRRYTALTRHLVLATGALAVGAVTAALASPRTSMLARPPTSPEDLPPADPGPDPAHRRRDQTALHPHHRHPADHPPLPALVLAAPPPSGQSPLVPPAGPPPATRGQPMIRQWAGLTHRLSPRGRRGAGPRRCRVAATFPSRSRPCHPRDHSPQAVQGDPPSSRRTLRHENGAARSCQTSPYRSSLTPRPGPTFRRQPRSPGGHSQTGPLLMIKSQSTAAPLGPNLHSQTGCNAPHRLTRSEVAAGRVGAAKLVDGRLSLFILIIQEPGVLSL